MQICKAIRRKKSAAVMGLGLDVVLPSSGVQVHVGVANQWADLITHPDQWSYDRQNADGLYLNFIQSWNSLPVGPCYKARGCGADQPRAIFSLAYAGLLRQNK